MSEKGPIQTLAELLRASNGHLSVSHDRFARSAFYDPYYRIMIVALVLDVFGKEVASGQRSIHASRLKLFQFIGSRPWLLEMIQEWSSTRRSGRFSVFSSQRLRRGFLGDTTHDRVVDLLVAHGVLIRAGGQLIASASGPLSSLSEMAISQELFTAERKALSELSKVTVTNRMLEGE